MFITTTILVFCSHGNAYILDGSFSQIMPLVLSEKDITWTETGEKIKIKVSFRSRVDAKLSMLLTSRYLKVNSPPWFWECFLFSTVNVSCSTARIGNNYVTFELKKELSGFWGKLESKNKDDKSFQKEERVKALEENTERLRTLLEENAMKKNEIYKDSVRKQMLTDDCERKMIERDKKAESEKMAVQMEDQRQLQERELKKRQLFEKFKEIPPTRKPGKIAVKFTPRVFPTASRESKETEEREWLEKQAAAAVRLDLDLKDLKPQERNPEWLKEKAEFLYNKQDYQGAVNAYNLAIRMCPNMYSLYLGRSVCHLHLRNLHKTIEDSSTSLDLLQPPIALNAQERMKAHKIRGMAFQQLDLPVESLVEFEAALQIDSKDEESKLNTEELRKIIQGNGHVNKEIPLPL